MTTLVKKTLHTSVAESIFREIGTRSSKYFFFLGKTSGSSLPSINSFSDELKTRESMVLFQEIKPSDACLVVPRIDWKSEQIYDMYDDNLSTNLIGINLKSGGFGYSLTPRVSIIGGGPFASGATAVATTDVFGRVIDVTITNGGSGYTQPPIIQFVDAPLTADGEHAIAEGVINIAASGARSLEDSKFYVLTRDYNVYKCLDNNYGARSTVKPVGSSPKPIKLSDGYVWRFLYTIPPYLRNKFLTLEYMPVVNNLNDNFYTNGEIGNVGIVNSGSGYTWAKINVEGDGYRKDNPLLLKEILIVDGGMNYESPLASIQPPFLAQVNWAPGYSVLSGEIIEHDNRFYRVNVAGRLSDSRDSNGNANGFPLHRSGIERNGNALLEFVGETAKAKLSQTNGSISKATLIGSVYDIELNHGGYGYINPPEIQIIKGSLWRANTFYNKDALVFWKNNSYLVTEAGTTDSTPPVHTTQEAFSGTVKLLYTSSGGATAYAQTLLGSISTIKVVNRGDTYEQPPSVVVGEMWYPNTYYSAGKQIFYEENLYTVTRSGFSGTSFPAHIAGEMNNSSIDTPVTLSLFLAYAGRAAKARSILQYGYGYDFIPEITVESFQSGQNASLLITCKNSSAKLNPIVSNGSIVAIVIEDPGIGYTYTELSVEGDGQGAEVKVDLTIGDLNSVQGNSQLLGEDGTINYIGLTSGGYGYSSDSLPKIEIVGDGQDAVATAHINPLDGGDKLLKIEVNNPGKNYRWANVNFVGGSGFGAKARAIISPYLGHGKDAVAELFASRLMFYTVFTGEKLFQFNIENEYRQLGIIKNPRSFVDKSYVGGGLHTSCVIVSSLETIDPSKFLLDMEIRSVTTGKKYRVVAIDGQMIMLESLQNDIPEQDELMDNQLTGADLGKFVVESVISPTVDKYSGDILYIENRSPFRPTELENITLRCVLAF